MGRILTMPKEGNHCSSELLGETAPYLVGMIFFHPCLAVILWEGRGRWKNIVLSVRVLHSCTLMGQGCGSGWGRGRRRLQEQMNE